MKKIIALFLCCCTVVSFAGCSKKNEETQLPTDAWAVEVQPIARSAYFADNVCKLLPKDENYVYSPLSVRVAFAMVANGAQAETKAELLSALNISDLEAYNTKIKMLMEAYDEEKSIELHVANSLWIRSGVGEISNAYADRMHTYYDATVAVVTPENAVHEINAWASKHTNGKIREIATNRDFEFFLANATYMKADWETPFRASDTHKKLFQNIDGTTVKTDFMYQKSYFEYGECDGIQILKMPYLTDGADISMYVLLGEKVAEYPQAILEKASFTTEEVVIYLPKFEQEVTLGLNEILQSLGAVRAFSNSTAQIQGILETTPLYVENSIQKSYICIDEKGTEAAAVTAVDMGAMSVRPEKEPIVFEANRPFVYIIRDNANGEILFMGQYVKVK